MRVSGLQTAAVIVAAGLALNMLLSLSGASLAQEADEEPASAFPAKWWMWAYRTGPWASATEYEHHMVPFTTRTVPNPSPAAIQQVGVAVRTTMGGSLVVHRALSAEGARLTISSDSGAGTYTGTVLLAPDSPIEVTVGVSDRAYLPLVALLAGLALALAIQRLRGVWSPLGRLTKRLYVADSEFREALRATAEIFDGHQVEALRTDWADRLGKVIKAIHDIEDKYPLTLDPKDEELTAITNNIAVLEAAPAALRKLMNERDSLAPALDRVEGDALRRSGWGEDPPDPDERGKLPRFIEEARRRFWRELEVKIDDLPGLAHQAQRARKLAEQWSALADEVGSRSKWLGRLEERANEMGADDRRLLGIARWLLNETAWDLWAAEDADDLDRRANVAERHTLERSLARLGHFYEPQRPSPPAAVPTDFAMAMITMEDLHRSVSRTLRIPTIDQPSEYLRWKVMGDSIGHPILNLVALGLLLYAGMAALYIGKPFGTWSDYLAAIAWGSAAKIGLDVTAEAIGGLRLARVAR